MTDGQFIAFAIFGGGIVSLVAAAFLLLLGGASEQEISRRISELRETPAAAQRGSSRIWPVLVSLLGRLGTAMRSRLLSPKDADALAKTLAASGFEPLKAMPIFVGTKITCVFMVPFLVWLGTAFFGYSASRQTLSVGASLVAGMMLPNWVIGLFRRSYQAALRVGIPDALDLLVVCAEAGLGLESAVERVAEETKQSNRPVGVEFSLLTHEMRVFPDRRIALANLAERTGQPALKRLAGTISQTLKYGTPLSQGLRTLAAEMRNERMIQFEERAGKLPALLVMPMMLFILPCLFIIILGKPASQLIGVFASLHH